MIQLSNSGTCNTNNKIKGKAGEFSPALLFLFFLNKLRNIIVISHKVVFKDIAFDMDYAVCDGIHKFCIVAGKEDISLEGNQSIVYSDDGFQV